jgi:hypothetical protein
VLVALKMQNSVKVRPMVYKEALEILRWKEMSNFYGKLPLNFWILLCPGQLEEQPWTFCAKLIRPIFFKSPRGKIPIRAHVKLQKLMLGAESRLRAIFSADFISLHQGLLGKKL